MPVVSTYQEFKDWLVTFLWKKGDQQLIANLDNLIRMGENEIDRTLRVEARHASANILVDALRVRVPYDCHSIRGISSYDDGLGSFHYVSPTDLYAQRDLTKNKEWQTIFSLEDEYMLFVGPAVDVRKTTGPVPPANPQEGDLWVRTTVAPGQYVWQIDANSAQWVQLTAEQVVTQSGNPQNINILLDYRRSIPRFQDTNASWLTDKYLDLYTYATLKHATLFGREDERLQVWAGMYTQAINDANEDSAFEKERGVYASKPLPRQAGIRRTKGRAYGRGPGV